MARDVWTLSDEELEASFLEAKEAGVGVEYEEDVAEDAFEEVEAAEEIEDDVEEEVEDLEQPADDEDSDDDASSEDEEEEESKEDSEDTEETSEVDEENTDEEEEESEEEEQPEQKSDELDEFLNVTTKTRANGVDYEFTNKEKLEMFDKMFPQATDYTKKMQAIKPYRKTIDAIEQAGLKHEDINLMIDVLKGDKDAIAQVMKRTGVDALDLDPENSNYVAKDYGRDETELNLRDVVDEISADKEYVDTQRILSKDWDDNSWNEMTKNPNLIKLLHIDVKSGMFSKVNPIAQKIKLYDGGNKSDLDYYMMAARQYSEAEAQNEAKQREQALAAERAQKEAEQKAAESKRLAEVREQEAKRAATKKASVKRKAAAPTKGAGMKKAVDYLDDSDEAFEEWYQSNVLDKQ